MSSTVSISLFKSYWSCTHSSYCPFVLPKPIKHYTFLTSPDIYISTTKSTCCQQYGYNLQDSTEKVNFENQEGGGTTGVVFKRTNTKCMRSRASGLRERHEMQLILNHFTVADPT